MKDIQVKIFRPVALPQKFFGAPALPALLNFCLMSFGFLGSALFQFLTPPLFLIVGFAVHIFLIGSGFREPHMTTLFQTGHLLLRAPRNMGRRSKTRTFYP
ncbi:hypothetical protein [Microvirga tunisiensis]|uniref:Uncharacterized protein n=1 Tax=Microvirga tunisiensis TaxID=2108360 RepID=A0A5N7MNQ9_9HYPH|nr:hypothetical protein [Microvirga tunisiensis]MPR09534.1 hypothetical protein [Microvirga tunisiensis]MPR27754.1 hypothetical protein [Microvirga tunisiensis]